MRILRVLRALHVERVTLAGMLAAGCVASAGCVAREGPPPEDANLRSASGGAVRPYAAAGPPHDVLTSDARGPQMGLATWYGPGLAGHRTASGERFDPSAMTAAHLTLPLGTWVEVRRTDGQGPAIRVRINDRGPFGDARRIIDLSKHAAQVLGILRQGTAEVSVRIVAGP